MKKFFAMLMSLIMVLSLVACGGSDTSSDAPAGDTSDDAAQEDDHDQHQRHAPGKGIGKFKLVRQREALGRDAACDEKGRVNRKGRKEDPPRRFQQFFLLPQWFSKFDGRFFYGSCINAGFNAMSDIPGLLVLLCAFYTAVAMPAKYRYACLFGAVYALACLIRINYIIIAPLFICIFLEKFKSSPRELFTAAAAGAGAFLLCFAPQFICNTIQFGSPLTFGYILHYPEYAPLDRPAAGFTWHTFSKLTFLRYLIQVNLPVFAIGTAALWCMRDRRNQMLLVLLAVPLVIFFCGYSHTFCDARRFVFPAFAAMVMALAAAEFWSELSWKELLPLCAALTGTLLFTTPWSAPWQGMPFALGNSLFLKICAVLLPCFAGGVIIFLLARKKYLPALLMILSLLFFHLPPIFPASGMFLLLPWLLFRRIFSKKPHNIPQIQESGNAD